MKFPAGFQWGVSTASVQIEGGAFDDGKGESIWDRFARQGKVHGGPNAVDVTCDHYHRWADDVETIAGLGVGVYRFSVSWPRIFPDGAGRLNQKGLDFYRRLIAALKERGVDPAVTLYHWDLPQALQEKGGWLNRDTAYRFAEYSAALFKELGADVPLWMTLNEPFIVAFSGHMTGEHAPGLKRPFSAMQAAHHLMLGHGEAVKAFRSLAPASSRIGLTEFLWDHQSASQEAGDRAAAIRADGMITRWFLDPVLEGHYPEDIWRWYRSRFALPKVKEGDLETIRQPIDFLGVQYYSRIIHRANPWNLFTGFAQQEPPKGAPTTAMGWEIYPEGLYKLLLRLRKDYGDLPLIVTENGAAFDDVVTPDGRVHDEQRVRYLQEHIRAVGKAIEAGVNVQGYYVWSLLDNLEWHHGTTKRFGLVHVDFDTLQRTVKESGLWYRDFLRGGAVLPDAD
ncbi:MAG TPA: GH1 family beta-glucosidase [Symbiobacteriaceae bacterium]|jgi:beta-glucosidase|nr:GH1 family beta-glucosidase [Symbiobacteriaceae bacterium]